MNNPSKEETLGFIEKAKKIFDAKVTAKKIEILFEKAINGV